MKRVYCLYRVSKSDQANGDEIPVQRTSCHEFAKRQGWKIIAEKTENGISGFSVSAKNRDAVQEIQKAALEKEFDILLVYMFDRIGRIDDETPFVVEWFAKKGIEVWSVNEGQQSFDNHVDKLMNYIRFWQASGESIKTSIRTKDGLGEIVQQGYFRGGTVPYGYQLVKNGRLNKKGYEVFDIEVNPDEAEYVRLIFQKYVYQGFGAHRIIQYLNDNRIFNHSGNSFSFSSIRAIIQNVIYTGILKSGETFSRVFPHLQIIENDIFERAQMIRIDRSKEYEEGVARRIPLNTKSEALISGLAFCAHCGGRLVVTTNVKKYKKADGTEVKTKRIRYRCYNKSRKICACDGQTEYTKERLDSIIDGLLFKLFGGIQALPENELVEKRYRLELSGCEKKYRVAKDELRKHTDTLNTLQNEIVKAIQGESKFDSDNLNTSINMTKEKITITSAAAQHYEDELNNRQQHIAEIHAQYRELVSWADMFQNSPKETKKMIIAYLIDSVNVGRGYEVNVKFNVAYEQFCIAC